MQLTLTVGSVVKVMLFGGMKNIVQNVTFGMARQVVVIVVNRMIDRILVQIRVQKDTV